MIFTSKGKRANLKATGKVGLSPALLEGTITGV
jgi:hypothetical protein